MSLRPAALRALLQAGVVVRRTPPHVDGALPPRGERLRPVVLRECLGGSVFWFGSFDLKLQDVKLFLRLQNNNATILVNSTLGKRIQTTFFLARLFKYYSQIVYHSSSIIFMHSLLSGKDILPSNATSKFLAT